MEQKIVTPKDMKKAKDEMDGRLIEMLRWIYVYTESKGMPPSTRDFCNGMSVSSTSVANFYFEKMIRRGWLTARNHRARSLRLTAEGKVVILLGHGGQLVRHIESECDVLATADNPAMQELLRTLMEKYAERPKYDARLSKVRLDRKRALAPQGR